MPLDFDIVSSVDAGGRVGGVDVTGHRVLMVTSNLGGNSWDSSIRIVDVNTAEVVVSLDRTCSSADICWAGGGRRAVCAEDSGDVKVYTIEEAPARLVEVAAFEEHDDIVSSVAAAHGDDGLVLSGSHDRSVKIWDIGSDRCTSLDTFMGHSGGVTGVAWKSGEGEQNEFASVSLDCSVRVWDKRQSQRCCACHRLGIPALTLSAEPSFQVLLAVGCEDGTVTILDKRILSGPVSIQRVHKGRVNNVKFSPPSSHWGDTFNSPVLASVGDDGVLALRRFGDESYDHRSVLHSDYVRALAWNAGNNIVTGGWDNALRIVRVRSVSPECP